MVIFDVCLFVEVYSWSRQVCVFFVRGMLGKFKQFSYIPACIVVTSMPLRFVPVVFSLIARD